MSLEIGCKPPIVCLLNVNTYANVILERSLRANEGHIGVNESIISVVKQMWTQMNVYFPANESFLNYSKSLCLQKCILTIMELYWDQRLRDKKTKLNILSSYADVVHTTVKQVISRRGKNQNVNELSKNENCTCKAC